MKFVIGFAGIPYEVYDQIYKNKDTIATPVVDFVSTPLKPGMYSYDSNHIKFFENAFKQHIENDHHNELVDTAFAVILINHGEEGIEMFRQKFFPSTLIFSVEWKMEWGRPQIIRQAGNRLIAVLKDACKKVRDSLGPLKKELTERANRTPLLLPLRNFRSKYLLEIILNLQGEIISSADKSATIKKFVREIERHHPLKQDNPNNPRFFVDDRNIVFRAPGNNRHAFARVDQTETHSLSCLLSGRRRLGVPFDSTFHYDCTKGQTNLKASFYMCHGEDESEKEGNPHLNISPNDFVRL